MVPTTTSSALPSQLRTSTHDLHHALESLLPISGSELSASVYRDHLGFLLGMIEPVEWHLARVSGLERAVPNLRERFHAPKLRRDLGPWSSGPRAVHFPRPSCVAEALGVLYVFEGALLGARSLLPRLHERGILPGPVGGRYFAGYGSATGSRWKAFREVLDRVDPDHGHRVVEGARETFRALLAWRSAWCAATGYKDPMPSRSATQGESLEWTAHV